MATAPQKHSPRLAQALSLLLVLFLAGAMLPDGGVQSAQAARQYSSPNGFDIRAHNDQVSSSIGDRVWNDLDGDGVQEAGEGGIADVAVWLDMDSDRLRDPNEPSAITDANGAYLISNLTAGSYSVTVDVSTLLADVSQTGDPDGGNDNRATFVLADGEQVTTADFGYQHAALSISKTSSAGGGAAPGDTLAYVLTIRNNTAVRQTGITVNDPLPAGTSYVTGSSQVSGYLLSTVTYDYFDRFPNPPAYNNSNGATNWSANPWVETGENDGAASGYAGVVNDDPNGYVLRPGDNPTNYPAQNRMVTRAANLAGCTTATLNFTYRRYSMENDDHVYAEVSADGGNTWPAIALDMTGTTAGVTDSLYQPASYTLANPTGATQVRFRSQFTGDYTDHLYIDNVGIQCSGAALSPVSRSGGDPPALVGAAEGFALDPGSTMQVTFQARVNNPMAEVRASIDNTAAAASAQQPEAEYASTSDRLPPASLGDRVWHDANNNGIQEPGEPGISGVHVFLYLDTDGDGVAEPGGDDGAAVATRLTDASGGYQFAAIPSGRYFLVFEQPAGYAGVPSKAGGDDALDSDAGASGITQVAGVFSGVANPNLDAGLLSNLDYGDLPTAYSATLLREGGARHASGALRLGTAITSDYDGRPDPGAGLDSGDDGVRRDPNTPWLNGTEAGIFADLVGGSGDLGVWIDWNNDTDFTDLGEYLAFTGLPDGQSRLILTVPESGVYILGSAVSARFRLFPPGGAPGGSLDASDYLGYAAGGEVEDYRWQFGPTAIKVNTIKAASLRTFALPLIILALGLLAAGGISRILKRADHPRKAED